MKIALGTLIGLVVLVPAGAAVAQEGVIFGCAVTGTGQLRVLVEEGEVCKNNEIPISWNIVGLEGPQGPAGPRGDPGPPGGEGQRWSFIGITTGAYGLAGSGFHGMTRTCQSEFPGSRMCTTQEVISTVDLPPDANLHANYGWVQPVLVAANIDYKFDASGEKVDAGADWNCMNWASTSSGGTPRGSAVAAGTSSAGYIVVGGFSCASGMGVACCALVDETP